MPNLARVVQVRKNTGELVPFDPMKLKEALRSSGASDNEIDAVIGQVLPSMYDGITTKKIFHLAYGLLRKMSSRSAGRYKLKKALMEMGNTGFPFEQFVARLLESEGYTTQTGQIIQGRCVQHEVDVIARKNGRLVMAECKYHQTEGIKSDVKISLYVHSRFLDIRQKLMEDPGNQSLSFQPMLVTNTRFTEDAIQFGECSGLDLLSWDYPQGHGLKDRIDRTGFFPVTVLKSLTRQEKMALMDKGIVLCREIITKPELLYPLQIPKRRLTCIIQEAQALVK